MDVILITGPPCGGKTEYVLRNKNPEDLVIDADLIAQALGSESTHDHPGHIKALAARVRDLVTQAAVRGDYRAWVVSASPSAEETILHSDSICVDPGIDVCLSRLGSRPHWTRQAIIDWYEKRKPYLRKKTAATRAW